MGRLFGYGPGMAGSYFYSFGSVLFILLVVLCAVAIFKSLRKGPKEAAVDNQSKYDEALTIAKMRYAKGEISLEEYKKIVEVIK